MEKGDGFLYPLRSIGFEPFWVCDYGFPRPAQIFHYVIGFIGSPVRSAVISSVPLAKLAGAAANLIFMVGRGLFLPH